MNWSLFDGRYEDIRLLGSGGMAEVYLARDRHLRRDVALKILKERIKREGAPRTPGAPCS